MRRREFFRSSAAMVGALALRGAQAQGMVRAHNWERYDFGSGPPVSDRLNQGPFPQYPPDAAIPGDDVVMATTPSDEVVPNYGKGLITYITADMGTDEIKGDNLYRDVEELIQFPLGQQLYVRPTWREVQPRPGRLELPDYLKFVFETARKQGKRIGMRVQMSAPDYAHAPALPDFVLERVPKVNLVLSRSERAESGAAVSQQSKCELSAALRRSIFPTVISRAGRSAGGGVEWQSRHRVHRYVHVRLLGGGPHLAIQ